MKFIVDNWFLLVATAAICVAIGYKINDFIKKPSYEQISKVKEWLLWGVTKAESELGAGTGELKLHYVYDMFAAKFPYMVKIISFDQFSDYVDAALDKMKNLLKSNENVKKYIEE